MHYFDTSFLAPLFLAEEKSSYVDGVLRSLPSDRFVSHWLRVEFASLIARNVRMKINHKSQAIHMIDCFGALVTDSFYTVHPTVADFNLATSLLQNFNSGLRAGDALHLAIAQNHGIEKFYTLDQGLAKAVKMLTSLKVIGC